MENKRNTTMLIIITIAVFLVAVLGATYAYFATERSVGSSINANVGTAASMYSFSATSTDKIEMDIAFNEMSEANVSTNILKTDNATIDVSLSSPTDDTLTTCTYDIVWVWDDGDMYTEPDVESLPYTHLIPITKAQYNDSNFRCATGYHKFSTGTKLINGSWQDTEWYCRNSNYKYEFSTKVDKETEMDLSKLTTSDNKVTLQEGLSITSESTTATTKTHEIKANIYNLPVEQTNLFGKNFKAHVTIDNLSCSMGEIEHLQVTAQEGSLAYYLMNNVYQSEENQTNISNKAAGLYYHNNALPNGANDKTLRYAGADADVNNYVCFEGACTENDLYRIISVDSTTNQTKVIKATSLGDMKWNEKAGYTAKDGDAGLTAGESYDNIWAISNGDGTYYTSSLNDYLNGTYLTSLGDKANKIVDTEWSVGGASYNADIKAKNVKALMDVELNKRVTYTSKIGLMYVSDYGFAALPEYWTHVLVYNSTKGYNLSKGKDWMVVPTEDFVWTITRSFVSPPPLAFTVEYGSGYVDEFSVNDEHGVRPSFVLSSDVKITNAGAEVGSKTNPMIIS